MKTQNQDQEFISYHDLNFDINLLDKLNIQTKDINLSNLKISKGSGKMINIRSLNVNPINNEFCNSANRAKHTTHNNLICRFCYSVKLVNGLYHKTCSKPWTINGLILSSRIYSLDELRGLKRFNHDIIRINSHGELINTNHGINLLNIASVNPSTYFVLWTKRHKLFAQAMRYNPYFVNHYKPRNLDIIHSDIQINSRTDKNRLPKFIKKVFTVYDKHYAKREKIKINCAGLKCRECMICYTKDNKTRYISELIK